MRRVKMWPSRCSKRLRVAKCGQVIPTWRLVLEPGCEAPPEALKSFQNEEQKLAAIEAELRTLRALGRHPNLVGAPKRSKSI